MPRKPQIRFTKAVKKFILQKMAEGNDIAQICEKWPLEVPHKDSIYRKGITDPEFAKELDQAYTILLMNRMDELHALSSKTAAELYPTVEDWRQAEAALKRRIDVAKFTLAKLAPVLSKRFQKQDKLEVSHTNAPQIAVINYHSNDKSTNNQPVIDVKPDDV